MSVERPVVHLHIGAMKTGTTHLQELMVANAAELEAAGFLFPLDNGRYTQTMAVRDVLNMKGDPVSLEKARGEWDRAVKRLTSYDGKASIFSMEFLSFARPHVAKRVVSSFEGVDLRIIMTVRNAESAIPAQWQQAMQSQRTTSWRDFVEQIKARDSEPDTWGAKTFRRTQDIPRMLDAWLTHVSPSEFTVVTVPPSSAPRGLLWERFAAAIGLDPTVATRTAPRSNESIGAASAELLRRINENLVDVPISDYRGTMRHSLARGILSDRASTEGKAPITPSFRAFAAEINARTRAAITESGVQVIGDLDDLPAEAPAPPADDAGVSAASDDDVLQAAAYAIPKMRRVVEQRAKQLRKQHDGSTSVRHVLAELPKVRDENSALRRWRASTDPASAAVDDMTAFCREGIALGIKLRQSTEPAAKEA